MHAARKNLLLRQEFQLLEDGCGLDEGNFREISVEVRVAFVLQTVKREEEVEQNEQADAFSRARKSPSHLDLSLLRPFPDIVNLVHYIHTCTDVNTQHVSTQCAAQRTVILNNSEGGKAHAIQPRIVSIIDEKLRGARVRRASLSKRNVTAKITLEHRLVVDCLGSPLGREGGVAIDANLRHEAWDNSEKPAAVEEFGLHELLEACGTDWCPLRINVHNERRVARRNGHVEFDPEGETRGGRHGKEYRENKHAIHVVNVTARKAFNIIFKAGSNRPGVSYDRCAWLARTRDVAPNVIGASSYAQRDGNQPQKR
jgi:hypothetical protein